MKTWTELADEEDRRIKHDHDATEILGFLAFWGFVIFVAVVIMAA